MARPRAMISHPMTSDGAKINNPSRRFLQVPSMKKPMK
jgi:hypothetical protein